MAMNRHKRSLAALGLLAAGAVILGGCGGSSSSSDSDWEERRERSAANEEYTYLYCGTPQSPQPCEPRKGVGGKDALLPCMPDGNGLLPYSIGYTPTLREAQNGVVCFLD